MLVHFCFLQTSISIGLSIAMWALVSKNLWAKKKAEAQKYAIYISGFILATALPITLGVYIFAGELLSLLWAQGETLNLAIMYLRIVIIGMPLMAFSMWLNSILRSQWEAKNSMLILLIASIVNGILDPILIFWFDLWLQGAAYATLASRLTMFFAAMYYIQKNKFFSGSQYTLQGISAYIWPIILIALPAVLTNLATPIGNAYVTRSIASFWDSAVAGMSMVWRVSPVAFAVIFALSGAIWPIIGQNLWANRCDRVRKTVFESIKFSTWYIIVISTILFFFRNKIVDVFSLTWEARELWILFLSILSWLFIFQAFVFISNAVFNNVWLAKTQLS